MKSKLKKALSVLVDFIKYLNKGIESKDPYANYNVYDVAKIKSIYNLRKH